MILAVRYGSAFQRVVGSAFVRTLSQASPDQLPLNNPILVKYNEHVAKGQLEADQNQLRVVQSLALLFNELLEYSQRVKEHSQKLEAYQARHAARVSEIQAAEVAQGPRAAPPPQQPGSSSGLGLLQGVRSWVASALQGGSAHSQGQGKAKQLTPEQQAKLDAARWAGQATRELGPPPPRPPPPRGRYIHGSVGSGKSLLMDLFYQEVASAQLGLHRRQHFNAAMLEIHQRMHQLDKRIAAEQSALAWADGQALGQAAQQEEGGSSPEGAAEEEDEQPQAASGASQGRHGLSRFWDQEVVKQKAAKRAVLAVKRHLRMSQPGRVKKEDLAAANSQSVLAAVSSFLSSQHGQVEEGGAGRLMDPEAVPILCLDEMQISDVFSAIALKGLVESLTKAGGIFVCTSNRSPDELPRHGLHEVLFDHFIGTLHKHCEVVQLSSHTDYRKLLLDRDRAALGDAPAGRPVTYLHPLGPDTHSQLQRAWATVCDQAGAEPAPISVPVAFGRSLTVLGCGGAAYVEFPALFAACTGPCDFIALANYFHTVFIANVPCMSMQVRDQARRFITAIDELYNARTRLIVSAAAPPDMLFLGTGEDPIIDLEQMQFESAVEGSRLRRDLLQDGAVAPLAATPLAAAAAKAMLGGQEEQFAFSRAVSRLCEMQSATYLMAWEATRRQQGTAARGPGT
ncbi:AFG1-like ATPase-domain-containing protein [Haematococcus lacustris]